MCWHFGVTCCTTDHTTTVHTRASWYNLTSCCRLQTIWKSPQDWAGAKPARIYTLRPLKGGMYPCAGFLNSNSNQVDWFAVLSSIYLSPYSMFIGSILIKLWSSCGPNLPRWISVVVSGPYKEIGAYQTAHTLFCQELSSETLFLAVGFRPPPPPDFHIHQNGADPCTFFQAVCHRMLNKRLVCSLLVIQGDASVTAARLSPSLSRHSRRVDYLVSFGLSSPVICILLVRWNH